MLDQDGGFLKKKGEATKREREKEREKEKIEVYHCSFLFMQYSTCAQPAERANDGHHRGEKARAAEVRCRVRRIVTYLSPSVLGCWHLHARSDCINWLLLPSKGR